MPRERNSVHQGSKLYPYANMATLPRSGSVLSRPSTLASAGATAGLPSSYSLGANLSLNLSGKKRPYGALSVSPPRSAVAGQRIYSPFRAPSNISPTHTDFSTTTSEAAARANKRQKKDIVWIEGRGFVAVDVDGKPVEDREREEREMMAMPQNEAERTLVRLESLRRPQIDSLRSRVSL